MWLLWHFPSPTPLELRKWSLSHLKAKCMWPAVYTPGVTIRFTGRRSCPPDIIWGNVWRPGIREAHPQWLLACLVQDLLGQLQHAGNREWLGFVPVHLTRPRSPCQPVVGGAASSLGPTGHGGFGSATESKAVAPESLRSSAAQSRGSLHTTSLPLSKEAF